MIENQRLEMIWQWITKRVFPILHNRRWLKITVPKMLERRRRERKTRKRKIEKDGKVKVKVMAGRWHGWLGGIHPSVTMRRPHYETTTHFTFKVCSFGAPPSSSSSSEFKRSLTCYHCQDISLFSHSLSILTLFTSSSLTSLFLIVFPYLLLSFSLLF